MKYLIVTVMALVSATASAHRVDDTTMVRCRAGITPEKCSKQRELSKASGCITPEEFDALVARGGMPTCYQEDNSYMGWCPCGCFAGDTLIQTNSANPNEVLPIQTLIQQFAAGQPVQVSHLSDASTVNSIALKTSAIKNVSVGPEDVPTYVVKTEKNGQIELSQNHPVVLADGSILRASKLAVGQQLLTAQGQPATISQIDRRPNPGLVYNLNVGSPSDSEHVLIGNGFLMGDLYLQGSLNYFENQIVIRQ